MLYRNEDSHTLGSISLTHTQSREEWALYWCLRHGGKNNFLPIFLSEVNGQHPSLPRSLPPTIFPNSLVLISRSYLAHLALPPFSLSLSVCLQHTFISLCGEPCCEHWPTGTLSRCRCAQWLLIVTLCAPASESCEVKREFVCLC